MKLYEKLSIIQSELNVPKGRYNKFSDFNYRSCEDIVEAAKPICQKNKLVLTLSDQIELMGERVYITAIATLTDIEDNEQIVCKASAKEAIVQKGMSDAQISGATSSYARKYALNGLFAIDDEKDADAQPPKKEEPFVMTDKITESDRLILMKQLSKHENAKENIQSFLDINGLKSTKDLTNKQVPVLVKYVEGGTK